MKYAQLIAGTAVCVGVLVALGVFPTVGLIVWLAVGPELKAMASTYPGIGVLALLGLALLCVPLGRHPHGKWNQPIIVWLARRAGDLSRAEKATLDAAARALGGARRGARITGTHEGMPFEWRLDHDPDRQKAVEWSAFLSVRRPLPGWFDVTRESDGDVLAKDSGLSRELQTEDPSFDQAFYIDGPEECVRQVFRTPERRKAVRDLFDLGTKYLVHDGKELRLGWVSLVFTPGSDFAILKTAVAHASALTEDFELVSARPVRSRDVVGRLLLLVAWASFVIGPLGGYWAYWCEVDMHSTLVGALPYTAPPLIAFLAVAYLLLKGRSWSHGALLTIALWAVIGFPSIAIAYVVLRDFAHCWARLVSGAP